jgi:hypothetical protein
MASTVSMTTPVAVDDAFGAASRSLSRGVKEYLAILDDTAWGAASDVVPKLVSPSDPAAQ